MTVGSSDEGRFHVIAERELERRAKHKLAVLRHAEEISGSVAATCRYYGITRTLLLQVAAPLRGGGVRGAEGPLQHPASLCRTPTSAEVIEKILWLRQQYHFGPDKIAMYLKRYHDITISPSGVWRILNKSG